MNNHQIEGLLLRDGCVSSKFRGAIPYDLLPSKTTSFPSLYVVNSDSSDGRGKHWMCIYMEEEGKMPELFDSLARGVHHYDRKIEDFIIKHGPRYKTNVKRIQGQNSDVCADYCILYAYFRCRGVSMEKFLRMFSDEDFVANDLKVELGM